MDAASSPANERPATVEGGRGRHIGVVGGGMLGLGLALRLVEQGHRVTVLEASPTVGGLASADAIGGVTWDRFYHVTLLSDSYLRDLLQDIGLADQLHWRTTRTGFFIDGRLVPMSSSVDFLDVSAARVCGPRRGSRGRSSPHRGSGIPPRSRRSRPSNG